MNTINSQIDLYLQNGCGRCKLYKTPQCKVHTWHNELVKLREIVLSSGLTEDYKWKQPCYTYNNVNVAMVTAFKEHCVISFFKGVLLKDEKQILTQPGENSQSVKWIKFTDVTEIVKLEKTIKAYIKEAIDIEKSGAKIELKKVEDYTVPEELEQMFKADKKFKAAFEKLTPGRQRGYLLHFTQPKQSATRTSRIEKCLPKILEGKGFFD